MPVIVLGGIYGGLFTPTEAAAVSALYGLAIGFFLYRTLTLASLWWIVIESAKSTGAILFFLSGALFIGFIANLAGLPAFIADAITSADFGPLGFLIMMNIVLLIAGCFLDGFTLLTIVTPLLIPTVRALGIDPVHFAIVLTLNIEMAAVTPPIGLNLFVLSTSANVPIAEIIRGVLPFILVLMFMLAIVTFYPPLSLFLVR